jgi:hypothetical protein
MADKVARSTMALRQLAGLFGFAGLVGAVGAFAACSSSTTGGSHISITDGAGGTASAGGGPASDAGGAFTIGGSAGGASGAAGAPPIMNLCGGHAFKAEPAPVDLYIMFDQSSSMGDVIANSNPPITWWAAAQQAVTNFVNDPRAAGANSLPPMTVGIQYFPLGGIMPQSCMADYKTPEVELAALPANSAALAASIQKHVPTAFTPTGPALSQAIAHMKDWAPNHVGHAPVVVLVTDGFPTECDPLDITDIAQIAKTAFESEPKVRTFVVGFNLGSGGENLKEIATAGGTNEPFLINGGDIGSQFVDAMLSISSTQLQCKFDLPDPPMGQQLDITQVAVTYTPSATGAEAQVPKLNGLGDCELNMNNGWFYDSPTSPTKIIVCPGTCAKFAAGVVKTASGCQPIGGLTR